MKTGIKISQLSKSFRNGRIPILKDLSLEINEGEVFGFLGPNGAGKTTLIRIMVTLLSPTKGTVYINNLDVRRQAHDVRKFIGVALQDTERSLNYRLTPVENAIHFGWLRGISRIDAVERVKKMAEQMNMTKKLDRHFIVLSGGEKQAFVVMRALVSQPRYAFLDEPSKSLDPLSSKRVRRMLNDYVKETGATLILTSHNLPELEELCDRIALINHGELAFIGSPQEIKNQVEQRSIIEIKGLIPPQAALKEFGKIGEVMWDDKNNRIRIICDEPYKGLIKATEIVERSKIQGSKPLIGLIEPSLEEAFEYVVTGGKNK
ncbi:MAG: ABC transporter ATP-binding protein [Candidatus Hodarchaeota archaeon]